MAKRFLVTFVTAVGICLLANVKVAQEPSMGKLAFEGQQSDSEQAQQQKLSNMKCLSLEAKANEQVYLFMAAKSAGSSPKAFANQCMIRDVFEKCLLD